MLKLNIKLYIYIKIIYVIKKKYIYIASLISLASNSLEVKTQLWGGIQKPMWSLKYFL